MIDQQKRNEAAEALRKAADEYQLGRLSGVVLIQINQIEDGNVFKAESGGWADSDMAGEILMQYMGDIAVSGGILEAVQPSLLRRIMNDWENYAWGAFVCGAVLFLILVVSMASVEVFN